MLNFVKVISSKIDSLSRRTIKFLRYGSSDVLDVLEATNYGVDSVPVKDLVAVYGQTSSKGKAVIIGYLNKNRLADIGETRLFSTDDSGNLQTYIWLKNDGTMKVGGDADNMVRYSELETAFNELKGDFNTLVTTFNNHIHTTTATVGATPVPGVIAPTTTLGTSSAADISGAKIDEIKTL
jgi:hypothetical protein